MTIIIDLYRSAKLSLPIVMLILLAGFSVNGIAQNLEIASTTPSANAVGVAAGNSITIEFSEDVNTSTINSSSVIIRGGQSGIISWAMNIPNQPEITLQPDEDFKPGETIHVTVTTGVQSTGGEPLSASHQFSFIVASEPAPASFVEQAVTRR